MNFDTFLQEGNGKDLVIAFKNIEPRDNSLDNEALFQLPLISIIILVLAKDRSKPNVAELGQLVGECIEKCFIGFKASDQHIGWSANLRIRTVKAISFLEKANLIIINNRKEKVTITDLGKKVVDRAFKWDHNLEYNLKLIARSYRNIRVSRQLDLELM
ncbi:MULTISPECIES: hypothetical protein [Enterobacterales]|jgi:hypothetical protein|uniref:hypothetical protein n=1 Tax=Enterobacterales TaxID=91347 RepID=UPI0011CAD87B|nr:MULTISPECIES: hypothetical protein [Enterobacterales]MDB2170383.1 hypothetical protein [Citrobacter farmeri]MDH1347055.1 hypothetical protein [Klebsiella michiganensis]TXE71735.1 hypothetical protein FOT59_16265 [Serratia nevei]